jgi:cystathionine beta-lyase
MKSETRILQSGKNIEEQKGMVNPPTSRTSTILYPTLESYRQAEKGTPYYKSGYNTPTVDISYGISGTPTTYALQNAVASLEGQEHALITPSGLSSITLVLCALLKHGDHVLISDSVYGPTRRFCHRELSRYGIQVTYYDPLIGGDIETLITDRTKLIFTESPGSLTFEVQDIPAITASAKKHHIPTVIDNSWATPLFFNPFDYGIDISIQAGTKYMGGHSDLLFGTVTCTEALAPRIYEAYKNYGLHVSPDDCSLALRGIRTLSVRLKQHEKNALEVAKWLEKHSLVENVLHPALPSCPGHEHWKRDFKGSSGLFSFIMKDSYSEEALGKFIDPMQIFGIGASWGGYESLVLPFDPRIARSATKWKHQGSAIRLHIGLENVDDILSDLEDAMKRLEKL